MRKLIKWNSINKLLLYKYSLVIFFITIPMPKYSLNIQAFFLVIFFWLMLTLSHNLKKSFLILDIDFYYFNSFYFFIIFGLIYSQNILEGINYIIDMLPFLIFPLIFLTSRKIIDEHFKLYLLKVFSVSTLLMSIFALGKSSFIYFGGYGSYFFYDKLSLILDKHPTYFSLFIIISITYFYLNIKKGRFKNNIFSLLSIFFLIFYLYLLSSRMSVLALGLFLIYIAMNLKVSKLSKAFIYITSVLVIFVVLRYTNNFQKRFTSIKNVSNSEISTRLLHWKSTLQSFDHTYQYLIGKGTGSGRDGIYEEYLKNGFEEGFKNKYNAHNQYLEFFLANGFVGLFLYVFFLGRILSKAYQENNHFGILFVIYIMIYSLTESILERQSGIIVVALFSSMTVFLNQKFKSRLN